MMRVEALFRLNLGGSSAKTLLDITQYAINGWSGAFNLGRRLRMQHVPLSPNPFQTEFHRNGQQPPKTWPDQGRTDMDAVIGIRV